MRIFIGCEEIASIISRLAEGFRACGHEVTTLVRSSNRFYRNQYTYNLDFLSEFIDRRKLKKSGLADATYGAVNMTIRSVYTRLLFSRWLNEHDVFIFQWNSILQDYTDLPILRKHNKKVAIFFVGSDIREPYAFQQEFQYDVSGWDSKYFTDVNRKLRWLRMTELYADAIFTAPDAAGLMVRPYHHLYLPLPVKAYRFKTHNNQVLKVVHAPSSPSIKGTDVILATLNRLKDEGIPIEIILLSGVPHEQLKIVLEESDVLVDELVLHGPGMLSLEAMASGCAVATRFLDGYSNIFNPPVCSINDQNIYERLKKLFTDIEYRAELIRRGREFVNKMDPAAVASNLLQALMSESPQPDYYPRFYLTNYKLPQNIVLSEDNLRLTNEVIFKFGRPHGTDLQRAAQEKLISPISEKVNVAEW